MGRGVMEFHVFVPLQPFIVFRFMGIQVIQNYVNFTVIMTGHDLVHERKKFNTSAPVGMSRLHFSGRDI